MAVKPFILSRDESIPDAFGHPGKRHPARSLAFYIRKETELAAIAVQEHRALARRRIRGILDEKRCIKIYGTVEEQSGEPGCEGGKN